MLDRWTDTARTLGIAIGIGALLSLGPAPSGYAPALAQGSPPGPEPQGGGSPAGGRSGTTCASSDKPLLPEKVPGKWNSRSRVGASVEIVQDDPKDPTRFTLHGTHDWQGTLADGKLVFKRKPTVDEMESAAPQWARQAVEGQIEWSLELEPKDKCGTLVLEGQWFPGRIKVVQEVDAADSVTKQQATSDGRGSPIDIRFERLPPRVFGVLVMEDQTGETGEGISAVPDYPYPFPLKTTEPNKGEPRSQREEYNPFFFSVYSEAAARMNGWNLEGRQQNRSGTGTRRTLYLYGQSLPRSWKDIQHITKDIAPGMGAKGLTYSVLAFDSDKPENLLETYKAHFRNGRARAVAQLASDPAAAELARHADAILIRVDLDSSALPGYKDFKLQDIPGPTQWRLQFGDDRALISFGRDAKDEVDLVDYVFLPERTFIEVKTEVPLPIDEIPLRVQIQGEPITWPGSPTLIAKRIPGDWTRRTYRTATIELVEDGNPQGPADPGVAFLSAHVHDELLARPADPGLLRVQGRPAVVLRTPAELEATAQASTTAEAEQASKSTPIPTNMAASAVRAKPTKPVLLWKEALQRAAAVGGVDVVDWDRLPAQQAAAVSNIIIYNFATSVLDQAADKLAPYDPTGLIRSLHGIKAGFEAAANFFNRKIFGGSERFGHDPKDTTVRSVVVTVGDLAALLMFRDEFRRRMADALRDDGGAFPAVTEPALVLGLRERLKGNGPDKSGWDYLSVSCPGGGSCEFTKVLDDEFLKQTFKDDKKAAEKWVLQAMGEAITQYKALSRKAKERADVVQDSNILGLIALIAADCTAEPLETPCGYQALRPLLLPRMVRLLDIPSPAAMQAALKLADQQSPSAPPMSDAEITALALQQSGERPRHLWIPDYNGRSVLRNLYSFIAAAKGQANYSSADTAVAKSLASLLAMPAASVLAVATAGGGAAAAGGTVLQGARSLLQALGACLSDSICGTILQELPNLPEYASVFKEVEFAQGASLVLGTERLNTAMAARSQLYKDLASTVLWTLAQEAPAMVRGAEALRAAEIGEEIASLRDFQALAHEDQKALLRAELDVKILEELGEQDVVSAFDRRIEAIMDKVLGEAGVDPARLAKAETATVHATGDATPLMPKEEAAPAQLDPKIAQEIAAGETDDLEELQNAKPRKSAGVEEKTERATLSAADRRALENQPAPTKDGTFRGQFNGGIVTLTLGDQIGSPSAYATVWRLAAAEPPIPGCKGGCVIKIYLGELGEAEAALDIVAGSRYLGDDVRQPKLFDPETTVNSPQRFLIMERLHFNDTDLLDLGKIAVDDLIAKFSGDPRMSDAVAEMFATIKNKNLAADDLHKGNIFLEKIENGWVAGTFDSDRIAPYTERIATARTARYRAGETTRVGKYFAHAELAMVLGEEKTLRDGRKVAIETLNSLRESKSVLEDTVMNRYMAIQAEKYPDNPTWKQPYSALSAGQQKLLRAGVKNFLWELAERNPDAHFANAEIMMIKMMEKKGFIRFDPAEGRWYGVLLYPGQPLEQTRMKDLFPRMFEPDHAAPIDVRGPFYKTGDAGDAISPAAGVYDLAEFRARRRLDARDAVETDVRQAA